MTLNIYLETNNQTQGITITIGGIAGARTITYSP